MHRSTLAIALVVALAACSSADTTPVPRLSTWAENVIGMGTIGDALNHEGGGIHCGPPGSGGGFAGPAPQGGLLGFQHEYTTCEYPDGDIEDLAAAWIRLGSEYLGTKGVVSDEPGQFMGEDDFTITWTYTYGPATGVFSISIVPTGDDTYRVLGNLQEFVPAADQGS